MATDPKSIIKQIDEQRETDYAKQVERVRMKVINEAGGTDAIPVSQARDVALVIVKEVAADRRQDRIDARMKR